MQVFKSPTNPGNFSIFFQEKTKQGKSLGFFIITTDEAKLKHKIQRA